MLSIPVILALLFPLYISTFLLKLLRNYIVARKYGFPIHVVPIHPNHVVWMLMGQPIRPLLKRHLPYWLYSWIVPTIYGWEQLERRILFRQKNTDSFMLVTCNKNELWTVDPMIVADTFKRPDTFRKTDTAKLVLETFGRNVFTSEGEAWARQRKIVTGIINERVSKVVFEESWRQTRQMTNDIEELRATNVDKNARGTYGGVFPAMKRIAANVLFRAGYGMPREFKEEGEEKKNSSETLGKKDFNMIQCISIYITDLVPAALIPKFILQNWPVFIPGARWMRDMGAAVDQIPGHIQKQLDDERRILDHQTSNEGPVRNNIMSMLIQASEYGVDEDGQSGSPALKNGKPQRTLSEDELSGNLLVFTIAGFETTANALTFALVIMMAEPKWQDWLFEEIDELFEQAKQKTNDADDESNDSPDYVAFFPKALRCLSVMVSLICDKRLTLSFANDLIDGSHASLPTCCSSAQKHSSWSSHDHRDEQRTCRTSSRRIHIPPARRTPCSSRCLAQSQLRGR